MGASKCFSSVKQLVTQNSDQPPVLLKVRSAKWFIVLVVSMGVFTDVFLYGVIVPVIPFALTQRVGVPEEQVQHWVSVLLAVYGAALLAGSPICGYLADRSPSRRLPLLAGLFALSGATIMLCVGSSIAVLAAGRALQGLSASVVWVVGLALLVDTVGAEEVAQYMGYVSVSMSVGILVAPLLGGVVYARAGYGAVYAMAFALLGGDVVLRVVLVEKKIAKRWSITNTSAAGREGSGSYGTIPPGIEATISTSQTEPSSSSGPAAVSDPEKRTDSPARQRSLSPSRTPAQQKPRRLPPVVTLLSSARLLASLWGLLIQAILMTSFDSVLPLYVESTFHYTSTGAGLIFLPLIIPTFTAPLVGWASDTFGPRLPASAGFLLAGIPLILLRLVTYDSLRQQVLLCALLALLGLCLTLTLPPLMAEMGLVVARKEEQAARAGRPNVFGPGGAYAQAYGLFNVAWAAGTLVGPIWAGFVRANAGWGTMSLSLGILSAASAVPSFVWTGGRIGKAGSRGVRWRRRTTGDGRGVEAEGQRRDVESRSGDDNGTDTEEQRRRKEA